MPPSALFGVAAGVAVLAGCGASHEHASGRAIFRADCSVCHTLTGHERGATGGDVGVAHLSVSDLASFALTMPVRPPLTDAQALAVARYVHAVAERLRRGR